jgi:hypothetical protein
MTTRLVSLTTTRNLAVALAFGEGGFTPEMPSTTSLNGPFDLGGNYGPDLDGLVYPGPPIVVKITVRGRAGAPTDNWDYDYTGIFADYWANGVNQVPALVGGVICAKRHDGMQAGHVASVVTVKQL